MVRFLHTADWQLGMTRRYLGSDAQPRFSAARVEVISSIGALAENQGCEFVLVCGDVFETNQVERQVVVRALDAMGATPNVTYYLLPGNHDPLDPSSVFRSPTFKAHCPANVILLDNEGTVSVAEGVELVCAPWTSKSPLTDLVARASQHLVADGTLRIAVGHGAVDYLSPDEHNPALIAFDHLESALSDGRLHYVALGDRHSTTRVGSTDRIWYSGAPEPTDFREVDAGNVLVVALDAASVSVKKHRVGTWRFVNHDATVTGETDLDVLDHFLDSLPVKNRTIVRLGLVGQLSLAEKARLDDLLAHHKDLLGSLEGWERRIDLVVLPSASDYGELELSGFAQDALTDLREKAESSGADAVVAREALSLLFRLRGSVA